MFKISLLLILLIAPGAWAQNPSVQLSEQLHTFLEGAGVNDPAIHDAFWADELVYTSSNGTRFGKHQLMKSVNETGKLSPQEVDTRYHANNIDIRLLQQVAVLNFTLVAVSPENQVISKYLNSGVFIWRDNRWQAVNWQATTMPMDH
ncbi:nuclear transport factor 2 family protein [Aestuariibacter sp. A3R04]|uniref:nuclear transport factor 2 family protein n=1 Tax=Aestuariibacter sp. A3R04 TaxID=2841571 RepID=UPI001C09E6DB|nr:nuclear transport factor 2 family protein [Aestuariibacter sp. A3R04]MBU3022533.1 nuclear transport factor 2 family protein [Aestuariibacter sp. A3R04]